MMRKNISLLLILNIIASGIVKCQDVLFSQYFLNSLDLNPAVAGSIDYPRLFFHYRNQWPAFGSTFVSYQGSYDQYIKSINGGIGLNFIRDNVSDGAITNTKVDIIYSRRFKINDGFKVQAGLQTSLNFFSINASSLNENLTSSQSTQPDVGIGFLGITRYSEYGLSVDHLNTGYMKFSGAYVPSPIKFSVFYKRKIKLSTSDKSDSRIYYLTPAFLVQRQSNSTYFNYGAGFEYNNLMAGLYIRNNLPMQVTNAIFAVGITLGNWRIGYSYDYNFLSLKNIMPMTGAHEITIVAIFPPDPKKQRYQAVPCPKNINQNL